MYIFAEPVTEEQANELQSYNDRKVEEFERNIIGLNKENAEMEESEGDADQWADMQANVEEEMDYDEASLTVPANSEEQSEQESIETSDDGPLGVSPSAEADGGDTKATLMEDHDAEDEEEDQEADKDEHELENAAEEDAEPITTEEDNSPGVEADRVEPQPEHDILATEDDETELVEGESPHPEASGDSQLGLSSAEEAKEVDDIDAANAASAVSAEAEPSPHTVTESASGELRVSGSDNPSDNEDFDTQADGTFLDTVASEIPAPPTSTQEVLAMTLTIRNKVNDRYVVRPEKLTPADSWTVEYALAEVEGPAKAWSLYQASQARRKKQLDKEDDDDDKTVEWYIRNLRELSKKGKEWRRLQDELDRKRPKVVLGQDMPEGRSGDGVEEAEGA